MADLMRAVCTSTADRIDAELTRIPGAAHEPQRGQPDAFNTVLARFWSAA
ncbi:hypothetical protein [Paractinoplanes lichenicola]|uniref:Alpha/beta hydrolase n=1 Tax=Paractinoplanes lichenicola TaxID=2802976 RepID=A0ABS1W583_9ACTN|nr:hypothetical protein [Actinoplanes lichenicola]MBL7261899.1 hypothetical protein [Actinoplanes lichenicola]